MNAKPNSSAGRSEPTPFQKFHALAKALVNVPRKEIKAKAQSQKKTEKRAAKND